MSPKKVIASMATAAVVTISAPLAYAQEPVDTETATVTSEETSASEETLVAESETTDPETIGVEETTESKVPEPTKTETPQTVASTTIYAPLALIIKPGDTFSADIFTKNLVTKKRVTSKDSTAVFIGEAVGWVISSKDRTVTATVPETATLATTKLARVTLTLEDDSRIVVPIVVAAGSENFGENTALLNDKGVEVTEDGVPVDSDSLEPTSVADSIVEETPSAEQAQPVVTESPETTVPVATTSPAPAAPTTRIYEPTGSRTLANTGAAVLGVGGLALVLLLGGIGFTLYTRKKNQ